MQTLLRQFEPFSGIDPATLAAIARHTHCVRFPADRWLLRPGRVLNHHHFLVRGRIRTLGPDSEMQGASKRARQSVYPGHAGLFTLSPVEMLRIGTGELDFLLDARQIDTRWLDEATDDWQLRFLRSHLMSAVPMHCWQRLLRVLQPVVYERTEKIITEGDSANLTHCYILASGRAVVQRSGRILRELGPGDFFGEDALLSQRPRNATVAMLGSGTVMCLPRAHFQRFLVEALISDEGGGGISPSIDLVAAGLSNIRRIRVQLDDNVDLRERLLGLNPCCTYLVCGKDSNAVALAVFLLRQRGVSASRLSESD